MIPQQYLPDAIQGTYFYAPSEQGYEETVAHRLQAFRERDFDEDVVKRAERYADEVREDTRQGL